MENINHRLLVCLLFLLVIHISATPSLFKSVYQDNKFLLEGIFQVVTANVDDDPQNELLVTGKNYTGQEQFIYCLEIGAGFKPVVKWRSSNLFEERSVLWVALGNFDGTANQLVVLTASRIYLYQFAPDHLKLVQKLPNETGALTAAAADLDGDGITELVTAKVGKVTTQAYNCGVEIWKLKDKTWLKVGQTGLLGNIRSLAAGDLDHDQRADVVVEAGLKLSPGTIRLYQLGDMGLVEKTQVKLANNGAIYAMKIREFSEGQRLITASTNGKINGLFLEKGKLVPAFPELTLKTALVDIEFADLNEDRQPEFIVAGYPHNLSILTRDRFAEKAGKHEGIKER